MNDVEAPQPEILTLVTARVRDTFVRKPLYVDGAADIVSVCRELSARGATHALVRDRTPQGEERLGIFTTTDLRDALLRPEPPNVLPVREVARFALVEVHPDAEVFEALWLMVQHRVHRLLVREGGEVRGVLGQLDLVSFVANHSHVVAQQIDHGETVDELRAAAARIDQMVALLHGSGIRIERITRLVTELNRRLFARLWSLVAPPALVRASCLLVMGSEGRGEQILKTDQDNGLLIADDADTTGLAEATAAFNRALSAFGYPPCPGGIMLTNPLWCQRLEDFRRTLSHWVYGAAPEGVMHLAIFYDAAAVAGDATLLQAARTYLDGELSDSGPFLARFALPADQFQEPGNWWTRLTARRDETPLDLKKLGTFPIVHGVRALALQAGLHESSTAARLQALAAAGRLDAALARDLLDALHFLMGLRLSHQLRQRGAGQPAGNSLRAAELGTLEREPLHDALAIVRRFRQFLREHFRLDAL
ncbi:putative nucleotidyltransferase substrate binding domain-containing protein [Pseudorhodoferax sp.]|uniref:putative nucleotidyltransferase substrate binding domain-containing protein n=1 Tax=Pseudorhodoferax sp. TaxID=1993553 RepID=UPI002DD66935|nr:putative nucleotidyltransferase substrate binding domain-containing protein [Pseudorhodoferax sp.]